MAPSRSDLGGGPEGHPWLERLLACAFWVAVWGVAAWRVDARFVLASPAETLLSLVGLLGTGEFWASVARSMAGIVCGFASGSVAGIVLAGLASRARWLRSLLSPLVGAIKAAPVASFVIVVLLWVPSRRLSVIITFLMAFPIVYTNVLAGVDATDPQLIEMADVFGMGAWDRVRTIYASSVMPHLSSALSLAAGFCWKSGIAAEVIGLPDQTVGEHLYNAKVYLDTPALFAWTLVVIALSVLLGWALRRGLAWVCARWEGRP